MKGLVLTSRYAVGMALQHAVLFALVPLYTVFLTPEEFGVWAVLLITVTLLMQIVMAPVSAALTRFYYHPKYRDRRGSFAFTLLVAYTVQMAVLAGIYLLAASTLDRLLFPGADHVRLVQAFGLVLLTSGTSMLLMNFLQLVEAAWSFVVLSIAQAVVTAVVTVLGLLVFEWGIFALVIGHVAGQGLQILGAGVLLRKVLVGRFDASSVHTPLRFGYLSLPTAYGGLLLQGGDRYVINAMASTAQVGLYAFGSLLANVVTIVFARPIIQGLTPIVHQLEHDRDRQRAFIARVTLLTAWAGTWLAMALACFAEQLTGLLARSPAYRDAWVVIPILVFARVLQPLSGLTALGLHFANRPGINSVVTIGVGVFNLLLTAALVPYMGIVGAALGTLLAMLAWVGLNTALARRFYDLRFDVWRIAGALVVGATLAWIATRAPQDWPWTVRLGVKVGCLASFPVALRAVGILGRSDTRTFLRMCSQVRAHGVRGVVGAFLKG